MEPTPQPTAQKPEKRVDYVTTEIKAMNLILTAIRRLAPHRRPVVMKYINDLFETSGIQVKDQS